MTVWADMILIQLITAGGKDLPRRTTAVPQAEERRGKAQSAAARPGDHTYAQPRRPKEVSISWGASLDPAQSGVDLSTAFFLGSRLPDRLSQHARAPWRAMWTNLRRSSGFVQYLQMFAHIGVFFREGFADWGRSGRRAPTNAPDDGFSGSRRGCRPWPDHG